jgi:hypothetical protein
MQHKQKRRPKPPSMVIRLYLYQLLMRITVQVTASKVSAPMAATAHQVQVLPTTDFILMTLFLWREIQLHYSKADILAGVWEALY